MSLKNPWLLTNMVAPESRIEANELMKYKSEHSKDKSCKTNMSNQDESSDMKESNEFEEPNWESIIQDEPCNAKMTDEGEYDGAKFELKTFINAWT